MDMKNVFILNPVSGKGRALKFVSEIEQCFKNTDDTYIIEYTKYPKHATELAAYYAGIGAEHIFSVGGDGTLSEVLNGMINSDSVLGVIPAGSGNDFFKTLTKGYKTKNIVSRTINGNEKYTDAGIANGKYFLNIISVGFDAQVAHITNYIIRNSVFAGSNAYYIGILLTLIQNKAYKLNIKYDNDIQTSSNLTLIAVANGKYYGSGVMAAPYADIYDGCFDTVIVDNISRLKILKFFPKYKVGKYFEIKEVSIKANKKVKIESEESFPLNLDGETIITNSVEISIIPKVIKIIVPKFL
jgi:YegS/Rv2252/BmrU family lipid kinase